MGIRFLSYQSNKFPCLSKQGNLFLNAKHNLSLRHHFVNVCWSVITVGADRSLLLSSSLFLLSDELGDLFGASLHYILKLAGTIADLVGSEEIQSAQLAQSSEDTD